MASRPAMRKGNLPLSLQMSQHAAMACKNVTHQPLKDSVFSCKSTAGLRPPNSQCLKVQMLVHAEQEI